MRECTAVIADWDADGAVSAAVVVYSQKYEGVYPLRKRCDVDLYPAEPYGAFRSLEKIYCYEALVILDVPVIKISLDYLRLYRERCGSSRIVYVDHHLSTHRELERLTGLIDETLVGYVPTSRLIYDKVLSVGVRANPRLERFVQTIYYMDQGLRPPTELRDTVRLLASISKYMAYKRDEETWMKVVNWLAPRVVHESLDPDVLTKIYRVAEEIDNELRGYANEIAVSAQRLGVFRFVDARKRWRRKGASSLASALYRIFRCPVALIVSDPHERDKVIMIIKYPGRAYRVAIGLEKTGVADSIGGHSSLAIVKFSIDKLDTVKDYLKRLPLSPPREI